MCCSYHLGIYQNIKIQSFNKAVVNIISLIYLVLIILFFSIEKITNKRAKFFLPFLIIIFFVIIMGGTLENPDSNIYANIYKRDFFDKDIGFGLLINLFKSIGFSLNATRFSIAVIGIFLINKTVNKYLCNTTYFYILYGIYPFLYDVVQVRNFLAMALFVYAIPFLASNKKIGTLKYVLIVLVAATIQKVAILYLPIIFIKNLHKKRFLKQLFVFIFICSSVVALNRTFLINFINSFLSSISHNLAGLENYLDVSTRYGWILLWAQQFANFGLIYWANNIITNTNNYSDYDDQQLYNDNAVLFTKLMYNINLYMFIFLPLFIIDATFTRIIRNVMPLNIVVFCFISLFSVFDKKIKINNYKFTLVCLLYQVTLLYLLCSGEYWNTIVIPIFTKNWIWNTIFY